VHKSNVEVYSLAYPPLSMSEVIQPSNSNKKWILWIIVLVAIVGLICIGVVALNTKRHKRRLVKFNMPFIADLDTQNIVNLDIPMRKSKSSIYLLGGFQVFDKEGVDITSAFTPTLKQLFLIVFLYTIKTGRGISTSKLNEILWFDKSDNKSNILSL
jgi:hypothetical protein